MIRYYQRVPSAAVRGEPDGNAYALSNCRLKSLSGGRVTIVENNKAAPRMLRVDFIKNGEAYVYLGCAGLAIATRVNLPFSVDAIAA